MHTTWPGRGGHRATARRADGIHKPRGAPPARPHRSPHRLDLATRSNSSFFCITENRISAQSVPPRGGRADLNRVRVGRALRRVDELIRETLGHRLHVAERGLARLYVRKYRISVSVRELTESMPDGRTPVVRRAMAWLTRRRGDTSTAWRRTVPWEPIRVESSRGPVLTMASTRTWFTLL